MRIFRARSRPSLVIWPIRADSATGSRAYQPAPSATLTGAGISFPLTADLDGTRLAASGEITAFEPARLISYRFFIGRRAYGLRITCTAQAGGTRIHVHQSDNAIPLTIDLTRLTRDLAHAAG